MTFCDMLPCEAADGIAVAPTAFLLFRAPFMDGMALGPSAAAIVEGLGNDLDRGFFCTGMT